MFPYSLDFYRSRLKAFSAYYNLPHTWTPHGARAGYASESRAAGKPFTEIQEEGRWISASSLRIYIDCVGAAAITTDFDTRQNSQLDVESEDYDPLAWRWVPYHLRR